MFEADSENSSDDGDTCQSSCRIINESQKDLTKENHDKWLEKIKYWKIDIQNH